MSWDKLPVFDGKDFPVWKMVLRQFLASKSLEDRIEAPDNVSSGEASQEDSKRDSQALPYITRSLTIRQARDVLGCRIAHEA